MSDRDTPNPHYKRYTPDVAEVFSRLGYDVRNQDDLNKLGNTLRYAERLFKRDESFRSHRLGWYVSVLIAAVGAILGGVFQWVAGRLR